MTTLTIIASICSILGFLVGIAATTWGRRALIRMYRSFTRPFLGQHLASLGVTDFFDSRESLASKKNSTKVFEYMAGATKEIGIIATSLNYSLVHQNLHVDLKRMLQENRDLRVYVFLLDPEAAVLPGAARATGRPVSELKQYILQSRRRLESITQSLEPGEAARLSVNFYDVYVANSMLVVDPYETTGKILVEHYAYKVPIDARYSFECARPESGMYTKMRQAYEQFKEDFAPSSDTAHLGTERAASDEGDRRLPEGNGRRA